MLDAKEDIQGVARLYEPALAFQRKVNRAAMFQRIALHDKTAIGQCVDTYGGLIWSISKHETNSIPEAEQMTQSIFADIWRFAKNYDAAVFTEKTFVLLILNSWLKGRMG